MTGKNLIEIQLEQIASLIKVLKDNLNNPDVTMKLPPDYTKKLGDIMQAVDTFNRYSEFIMSLSDVSKEELQLRLKGLSKEVPDDAKQVIDQGNTLKKEVEKLQKKAEEIKKATQAKEESVTSRETVKPTRKLTEKEQQKKRRSKFKRFGGDEKWKPL